jgi:outer membrane receptor protein involved in Fe transport
LVDGQRLAEDAYTGAVDISLIPLPVIDHIDVLSGGASAIYGSDAVAGVVNIVLIKDFEGSKTTLLGGGTADGGGTERDVNEMLGRTWEGGGAIVDYESDVQDPILASQRDYTESAGSPTTTLPGTSRSSFFASAHQNLGGAVSVFGTGLYTNRSTHYSFSNGPQYPTEADDADVHEFAADGGLNASVSSDWSLSVVGDYSEDRTDLMTTALTTPPENSGVLLNEGLTKSMEATATGPILTIWSGKVRGAAGLGYRRETYNYAQFGESDDPGAHRTVRYAYGEMEAPLLTPSNITWRRELTLDLSGRFERYSDFGDESVPKLGLVYAPFSTIHVRGTWGKAFRAPSLDEMDGAQSLLYRPLPDLLSPTGVSDVLTRYGGNPGLMPEKARTWTIGIDYDSEVVKGLRASVTYFDVAYRDRIGTIPDAFEALIDPLDAPFVTRNPSEGLVQSLLNSATTIANIVGTPINPASVPAIVSAESINVASQDIVGGDVDVRYHRAMTFGELEPFITAALLDLRQKLVPGAPEVEISGLVFQPPKLRAQTGVSWLIQRWTITGIVNYSGSEVNTYQPSYPLVASWTTVNFALAWQPESAGVLSGLKLNLAVENAFNRDPPFVQFDDFVPGIHYDALNANALGRVIRVGASWLFE